MPVGSHSYRSIRSREYMAVQLTSLGKVWRRQPKCLLYPSSAASRDCSVRVLRLIKHGGYHNLAGYVIDFGREMVQVRHPTQQQPRFGITPRRTEKICPWGPVARASRRAARGSAVPPLSRRAAGVLNARAAGVGWVSQAVSHTKIQHRQSVWLVNEESCLTGATFPRHGRAPAPGGRWSCSRNTR